MPETNYYKRIRDYVIKAQVDVVTFKDAVDRVYQWAIARKSSYTVACNVHMAVTASTSHDFLSIINNADLAIPDGSPIAWWLRKIGYKNQERVCGPDLMWSLCEKANEGELNVFFLGSTTETLGLLSDKLKNSFPKLKIRTLSPPFRKISPHEDQKIINSINEFKTNILFVSLGCPKQEQWMASHKGIIQAAMIGVGAAFEFHAGTVKRAPHWMQKAGLEWLYRLIKEPRRLWKRYFLTNSIFVFEAIKLTVSKSKNKKR